MGLISSSLFWTWRRSQNKAQAAREREAKLAQKYTPRERRLAEAAKETDRLYRFTRDELLDAIDARRKPFFIRLRGIINKVEDNKAALGPKRHSELVKLITMVKQLP